MTQFNFFIYDVKRMLGRSKLRLLIVWLSRGFWGCLIYRFERSLFLVFGKSYKILRIPLIPIINILQAYSNIDIHYKANIKGGILVLHPSVGCVISGQSVIGKNITLTGGNVIGAKGKVEDGTFVIGNNCEMGANATIVGPVILANNITIGASACVINSESNAYSVLVGVPAKRISKT